MTEIIASADPSHSAVEVKHRSFVAFAGCLSAWDLTAAANVAVGHSGIASETSFAVALVGFVTVELG